MLPGHIRCVQCAHVARCSNPSIFTLHLLSRLPLYRYLAVKLLAEDHSCIGFSVNVTSNLDLLVGSLTTHGSPCGRNVIAH